MHAAVLFYSRKTTLSYPPLFSVKSLCCSSITQLAVIATEFCSSNHRALHGNTRRPKRKQMGVRENEQKIYAVLRPTTVSMLCYGMTLRG